MKYRYTTKQGIFETVEYQIPWRKLHSLNGNPAFEDLSDGYKAWYFKGELHRETGPARIWPDGRYEFYLNRNYYGNITDWLENNPNQDKTFQAVMLLQYT